MRPINQRNTVYTIKVGENDQYSSTDCTTAIDTGSTFHLFANGLTMTSRTNDTKNIPQNRKSWWELSSTSTPTHASALAYWNKSKEFEG